MDQVIQTLSQPALEAWWWFQRADEAVIITGLVTLASAYPVAWFVQWYKRRKHDNLELSQKAKRSILWLVTRLSALFAVSDYILLAHGTGLDITFAPYFFGAWSSIIAGATVLHRVHVSSAYTKAHRILTKLIGQVSAIRSAKYAKQPAPADNKPVVPFQ